jgi:CRISPR system Cascade subunit CasA
MPSFDLTESGWVPCVPLGGSTVRELGIRETLLSAHEVREIYDGSPLVTVCLHRLLLAVLHRACGPATAQEWGRLWQAGYFPQARVSAYLKKWHDRFDLFSESHPFYQTAGLETKDQQTAARLAAELASGHNPALFDHTSDEVPPDFTPAEAARMLLACQSFALGFGQSSKATIEDREIAPPYSADAPLLRGVTLWLAGQSLFETLMLNLLPYQRPPNDIPAWELDRPYELRDKSSSSGRKVEPARGMIDRYTWQSRLIRLVVEPQDGGIVVRRLLFTQGRSEEKRPRHPHDYDPMKVYNRDEKEGDSPLPLSRHRAAWRDVHALLAIESDAFRPAEVVRNAGILVHRGLLDPGAQYGLHVVGVATAPAKAGKFLLWRHDRIPLPVALLQNGDLVDRLGGLLAAAESMARALRARLWQTCTVFLSPRVDSPDGRQPDSKDVSNLVQALDVERLYWSRLEQHFHRLIQRLPGDKDGASEEWLDAVELEARGSFAEACAKLGTSQRAIRAAARVSGFFSARPRENAAPAGVGENIQPRR